jgi:hypothetical protein
MRIRVRERHARTGRSGNDAAAPVGDQFADAGATQPLGLSALTDRFSVRESSEEFQPAAAPIGV